MSGVIVLVRTLEGGWLPGTFGGSPISGASLYPTIPRGVHGPTVFADEVAAIHAVELTKRHHLGTGRLDLDREFHIMRLSPPRPELREAGR